MGVSTVQALLAGLEPDADAMNAVSRAVARPSSLVPAITDIRSRPEVLAQVARRSIRHANGFNKIVLASARAFQIRLHVWHPLAGSSHLLENAHTHRWPFATVLLCGGYRATTFTETPGRTFQKYCYRPGSGPADYVMDHEGAADLRITSVAECIAGSSYWIDPSIVHRTSPIDPGRLTASLILIGPPDRESTNVFVPAGMQAGAVGELRHRPLSADDVAASLDAVLRALP